MTMSYSNNALGRVKNTYLSHLFQQSRMAMDTALGFIEALDYRWTSHLVFNKVLLADLFAVKYHSIKSQDT